MVYKNAKFSLFLFAILFFYFFIPFLNGGYHFELLGYLTLISVLFMIFGYNIPIADAFMLKGIRLSISKRLISFWIPLGFVVVATYTIISAPSVPLFSAFLGSASELLSEERGAFLKGRSGIESLLIYASTIFVTTLIPYSLVCLFAINSKYKIILLVIFFGYSISFLQKALFFNVIFPVLAYYVIEKKITILSLIKFVVIVVGLLLFFISLTFEFDDANSAMGGGFFSANYEPTGALDFLLWRAFSVPVFTAADTLAMHDKWFGGDYLLGATSSFFSSVLGLERINIERYVFQYQFGGWNDIANANAVFFLDGYINFGIIGIALYSIVVGQFFRVFKNTKDIALSSIWIVFAIGAFSGSLLSMLFGNGWLLVLIFALFCKNKEVEYTRRK